MVSSLSSKRVPSLSSDTDWMETYSDLGRTPAEHNQGKMRWCDYGYGGRTSVENKHLAEVQHRVYVKLYFEKQGTERLRSNSSLLGTGAMAPLSISKFDFADAEPISFTSLQETFEPSLEIKYSCSKQFVRHPEVDMRPSLEHVVHDHDYHITPDQTQGMQRSVAGDKKLGYMSDGPRTEYEKIARPLNIPIPVMEIVNLPMDTFKERLSQFDLSESQISLIREIRKRGKNKMAVENYRRRKIDRISSLSDEVKQMRFRNLWLVEERYYLVAETRRMENKCTRLYRHIFQELRDAEGNPYSPYGWSLQESDDGTVLLVPRPRDRADLAGRPWAQ